MNSSVISEIRHEQLLPTVIYSKHCIVLSVVEAVFSAMRGSACRMSPRSLGKMHSSIVREDFLRANRFTPCLIFSDKPLKVLPNLLHTARASYTFSALPAA